MSSEDRDRLLAHDYDGIEEYDNPLPGWWVWVFWATIVFSAAYWIYYQLGPGPSIIAQYEAEARAAATRQAALAPAVGMTDEAIVALGKDARVMAAAKVIFATRCMPCHGPEGQGLVGPNLTDDYWIHGRRPTEILHTIAEGVPDKGMVPWKDQLKPEELPTLAAYVLSLAGTNPPNPKAPQGINSKGERAPETPPESK
jgi:cytochrome c oxidase cbb3-type subunit III